MAKNTKAPGTDKAQGAKKSPPDWERIEKEYRAGQLSIREVAKRGGVTEGAVRKKAKADGWSRDLTKQVQAKIKDKLVRSQVRTPNAGDDQIVEEVADRGAAIIESHRTDINQGRQIAGLLMRELMSGTKNIDLLEELVDQQADDEEWDSKRKAAVQRAISLPVRAGVMRDLATSMKTLQALERQAFNLDDRASEKDSLDELLESVQNTSRGIDGYGAADS